MLPNYEEEKIRLYVKVLNTKFQVLFVYITSVGKSFNEVTNYMNKLEGGRPIYWLRSPRVWVTSVVLIP